MAPGSARPSARELRHLRQEHRQQPQRRQERADMIDKGNAGMVGELAEHRGTQPADTESDAEEYARNHPEAMRHQFLREHDDGRRRRREDQADEHGQHGAGEQSDMGQRSVNGSAPRIENQMTYLRPKRSPSGPPKNAPAAFDARKMKRYSCAAWVETANLSI